MAVLVPPGADAVGTVIGKIPIANPVVSGSVGHGCAFGAGVRCARGTGVRSADKATLK